MTIAPVRCPCLQLPFISLFVNVTFSGGTFRTTANTIPPLSRDVSALLGHESPFLVLLELGSAEEGRCGRKQRAGCQVPGKEGSGRDG